jgi:hypothetical protein
MGINPHDVPALTSKGLALENLANYTEAIKGYHDVAPHRILLVFTYLWT